MIIATCNSCGKDIKIEPDLILSVSQGDLTVEYFVCPCCNAKYQVLTTDKEMREMIARRQRVIKKISMGKLAKIRRPVFQGYVKEEQLLADNLKKKKQQPLRLAAATER